MTEDAGRPDPAAVEAEVRRALGDAYDSPDPRVRVRATLTPAAQLYAAVALRITEIKAEGIDELTPPKTDKTAVGREFGMLRQRVDKLKQQAAAARARRAAQQKGASAEA